MVDKRPTFVRTTTDVDEQDRATASSSSPHQRKMSTTLEHGKRQIYELGSKEVREGDDDSNPIALDEEDKPEGIRLIEAITQVWNRTWMYSLFALIWLIYFTDSLQQQANYSWTPYVTSSFELHGLTGTVSIVSSMVSGVIRFPLAKFIDVIGRPSGFAIMLFLATTSLVMMAACNNIATYIAAQTFYWTGLNGMMYVMNMFINDTTTLRNRAFVLALTSTPFICNSFAGPAVAQRFLEDSTWRWGYGAFAIITPIMATPFGTLLSILIRKAKKTGTFVKPKSGRTWLQSIWHYAIEFDVVGQILIAGGSSMFLLPFSLAAYALHGWSSPTIICLIVFGVVTIALFVVWEKYWAPKTVFPFHLLTNKSLMCTALIDANLFLAQNVYTPYFLSYLQVVFQLDVTDSGIISNIYNLTSCSWGPILGLIFRYTDRYKWSLWLSVPGEILFVGLQIYFRSPNRPLGYLIMCQVFHSIFTASLIVGAGIALQASVPHEHLAVSLALQGFITACGSSIGQAISGAMWTQLLLPRLTLHLPDALKAQAPTIFASLETQLSYAWGSPEREAIVAAYGDTYKLMLISGTCLLAPTLIWVWGVKNAKLSEHKNLRGTLI